MNVSKLNINIAPDGTLAFVHNDSLARLCGDLAAAVCMPRASNVEFWETQQPGRGWVADLSLSIDPHTNEPGPKLGPFKTRSEALAAELQWLNERPSILQSFVTRFAGADFQQEKS